MAQQRSIAGDHRASFVIVIIGSLLASLDLFIVNVAFGAIGDSFPTATLQTLQWVLVIYTVVFAALLIPIGRLADQIGRARTYIFGLVVFVIGSIVCGLAPDLSILIIGRGIQGVGAAALIPTSLGLLLAAYPPSQHKRVVSIWAASGSVAAAAGPVVGGLLVAIDWRWIFLINLIIALPALALCRRLTSPPGSGGPLPDVAGATFLAAATAASVVALSDVGGSPTVIWLAVAALAVFAALFVWRSRVARTPAVNLALFRIRSFSIATIAMITFYAGFAIMVVAAPLSLANTLGLPAPLAGLAFGLGPAAAVVSSIIIGRTALAPGPMAIIAGALFAIGGLWWTLLYTAQGSFAAGYLPGIVLTGLAAGIGQTALIASGTADLPVEEYSAGSGTLNTGRQIGSSIGIALFVALSAGADVTTLNDFGGAWMAMTLSGVLLATAGVALSRSSSAVPRP